MVYIEVTPNNAKLCNTLLKKNKWIVLYHWKQCGHCIELLPKWKTITKNENKCCIMEIEYSVYPLLQKKYTNVSGFPSIIVYDNGKVIDDFKEQRTLTNLKKFIKSSAYHNDLETKETIIKSIIDFENKGNKTQIKSKNIKTNTKAIAVMNDKKIIKK
jgi:hypothetical protein